MSTALWLQVTLIACYLPYSLLIPFVIHAEPSFSVSFFLKPDSLLLEARRGETSSKGQNQTSTLLLIELAVVQHVNLSAQ